MANELFHDKQTSADGNWCGLLAANTVMQSRVFNKENTKKLLLQLSGEADTSIHQGMGGKLQREMFTSNGDLSVDLLSQCCTLRGITSTI